jgi:hypothetical protein
MLLYCCFTAALLLFLAAPRPVAAPTKLVNSGVRSECTALGAARSSSKAASKATEKQQVKQQVKQQGKQQR